MLHSLARDRTTRSLTATLGASHQLSPRTQVAGDFTLSRLGGSPASGGVEALEGAGWEYAYFVQLIGSDVLANGDLGILGLRFLDGGDQDIATVSLNGRYPLTERLRVNPVLRTDFRLRRQGEDLLTLQPLLRLDYRLWRLTLDAEAGLVWNRGLGGATRPEGTDELGYNLYIGLRCDF